jgi:hypothetical protein
MSGSSKATSGQNEKPALNALDAYINNNDPSFRWDIVSYAADDKGESCVVNMVSQTWHDIAWKHTMYLIEPANLTSPEHCTLFITGGASGDGVRDFREAKWNPTDLQPVSGSSGNFLAKIPKPENGHVGFYIEIETEYKGIPCSLTTEVFNP